MRQSVFPSLLALCHQTVQEVVQRLAERGSSPTAPEKVVAEGLKDGAGKKIEGDTVFFVDGTCGKGHDALMLARLRRSCPLDFRKKISLVAFDIQEGAIKATKDRLVAAELLDGVTLVHKSHEHVLQHIPRKHCVAVAMYNLGYLPGCAKEVVTQQSSTLASLEALSEYVLPGGLLSVHSYAGHIGGAEEARAVDTWFCSLEYERWTVARYSVCNKKMNPEILYLAERRS